MPRIPRAVLLLLLFPVISIFPAPSSSRAAEEATDFKAVADAFDRALRSEDPDVRMRAFSRLHVSSDPRAVDLIVKSLKKIRAAQEKIRKAQTAIEQNYEKAFNKKIDADGAFERSSRSSRELDAYNKRVRKIGKTLDRLRLEQKSLENEFTRTRALMDGAVTAMSKVLSNMGPDAVGPALERVEAGWLGSRLPEDRIRWVYALAGVEGPRATARLVVAARNRELDRRTRAAALVALGWRKDPNAHHIAVAALDPNGGEPWEVVTAAIEALRVLHERRSIPPLIRFLAREDIKRQREDAHAALKSLTGEKHGPYASPWQRWWDDNKDRWPMPESPVARKRGQVENAAVTFYGITTFSDRIMFVLDISGSMEKAPTKKDESGRTVPAGPANIVTAKKELVGAINGLGTSAVFNVIFFNHEVIKWKTKMQVADERTKRQAIEWIEGQEPLGTTNIFDALEEAFAIALAATGEPIIDTVFFLTDGRPTTGKIRDPKRILKEVLEWNKAARVKIHTVGVGDHDAWLLENLARETGGEYVTR